jgi:peptide/nickel transport system ATP-binding protein
MSELLLDVEGLTIAFRAGTVVDDVSFQLPPAQCLALVGESGSGKTLTSRALLGLVPAGGAVAARRITVAGRDAMSLRERDWRGLRGKDLGLVSQDALTSLDPLRRIGAEVAESMLIHARRDGRRLTQPQIDAAVIAELTHVAIPEPAKRVRQYAHQLSGGQRQRALIASATINRPRLIVADEPTTALDVVVQQQVLELLERLKAEGAGLMLISHDLSVVARIAEQVAVMRAGKVVEAGPTAQVLANPQHEYTRALLAAEPSLHPRGTRLSGAPVLRLDSITPPDPGTPVLEVRDVAKSFAAPGGGVIVAVQGVSFTLAAGSTLGIVGESGSGKTTLGRIILGLQAPDRGEVLLGGEPWSAVAERDRRERRQVLQTVHQDPLSSFDPRATGSAILREALALSGVARRDRAEAAASLAARVGLDADLLRRRPRLLSGGQRQRLAMARALARNPLVLVCDEPVSALDVSIQAQVLDALSDVQEQLGLAMVFISHDLGVVQHMSDEVLVMRSGVVVERGDAQRIFAEPEHEYTRELLAALPAAHIGVPVRTSQIRTSQIRTSQRTP